MVGLHNRFLYSEEDYRQTLLGYEQVKQDSQNINVNMTVNGFYEIQNFKYLFKSNRVPFLLNIWVISVYIVDSMSVIDSG